MKGDTQAALNLHAAADHSPRVSLGSEGVRATTGVITAVPSLWGLLDALFKSLLRSSPFCAGGVLSFRQHFWFAFVSWVLWSLHGDCDTEMYTAPPLLPEEVSPFRKPSGAALIPAQDLCDAAGWLPAAAHTDTSCGLLSGPLCIN